MNITKYKLPVSSTSFEGDPIFEKRIVGVCAISFCYDGASPETLTKTEIIFKDVAAFRSYCFGAHGVEIINLAYDTLVDLGKTKWLEEVRNNLEINLGKDTSKLAHLAILFDSNPLYEFICESFEFTESQVPIPPFY